MLLGMPVSPGFVDKASARLDGTLQHAGFDDAMQAALAAEPALGADETPVNVLTPDNDPQTGEPETGSPHVLVIRTPGGNLTWLRALGSRRAEGGQRASPTITLTDIFANVIGGQMSTPGQDVLRRVGEASVLVLVSLADGPKHGYALIQDIKQFAGVELGPGTLYGALDRLERLGLIESLPADERRHPYRITAPGAAALRAHLDSLERVSAAGRLRLQLGGA